MKDINLFGDNLNLLSSMQKIAFEYQYPIGYEYIQYPMSQSPNELWGDFSTWEEVKFGGAFFRCEGHRALGFTNYAVVKDYYRPSTVAPEYVYSMTFDSTLTENQAFCVSAKVKDYIVFNEYIGEIGNISGTSIKTYTIAWEGGTPPTSSITNGTVVYIMQSDAIKKHTHSMKKLEWGPGKYTIGNKQALNVDKFSRASDTYSGSQDEKRGSETRGKNLTIKVWRRTE